MGSKKISVVLDTGPLIHLSEIECINLLRYFNNIYVPESVRSEYIKHRRSSDPNVFELGNINLTKIQDIEVRKYIDKYELFNLHLGEKECLYLCHKLSIDLILTDDLAVRDAAKKLDITPIGSLGVIIKSFKERIISLSQAERYIINLYEISSLYVTKSIVELVTEERFFKLVTSSALYQIFQIIQVQYGVALPPLIRKSLIFNVHNKSNWA